MSKLNKLRSEYWFNSDSMRGFAHRQRLAQVGYSRSSYIGKPVIGIISTWSEISTCHSHFPQSVKFIREGIIRSGGFPLELPALSLSEVMVKPTTMLYRNLLAMEAEELILSHPLDAVVLLGGCDKTIPGLLMGAFSANLPCVVVPAGATINGSFKGIKIGTGTHTRKYWDAKQAGEVSKEDWLLLEETMTRSAGTCNTMGTASTMACIAEALGLTLANASTTPAVDSAHGRICAHSGELAVNLALKKITPSTIVTEKAVHNAITVYGSLGGSTNAVIHLIAMVNRLGLSIDLKKISNAVAKVPVIANLMPAGEYLMEDLHNAGGLLAIQLRIKHLLDLSAEMVTGERLETRLAQAKIYNDKVVLPLEQPLSSYSTLTALYGNLCPNGAVIKPVAATPSLMEHRGMAVVFESMDELQNKIDSDDLMITERSVLVLKNAGPVGAPGMPEWGGLPIPKKLLSKGVRDLVRISDARMSGTHFGTCVLHVSPESAIGGPLGLVQQGDEIEISVSRELLQLHISDSEMEKRSKTFKHKELATRGYLSLYQRSVQQAHVGCDFDFMLGKNNASDPIIF
ncbi:MAG: dihydroxy-acid dehydratase [Methylacidiphilales bacterium]|nr:dihydroxy-acid dehydratase [Candidatus Methylacidiphilales bacterium]